MSVDALQALAESFDPEPDPYVGGLGLRARAGTPYGGGCALPSEAVATTDSDVRPAPGEEAADLYLDDRYLGSLPDLARLPDLLDVFEPGDDGEYDGAEFERRALRLLGRSGVTSWPWATADSSATPWAYVWRANSVQVYRSGRLYGVLYPSYRRARSRPSRSSPFPTMREDTDSDE